MPVKVVTVSLPPELIDWAKEYAVEVAGDVAQPSMSRVVAKALREFKERAEQSARRRKS